MNCIAIPIPTELVSTNPGGTFVCWCNWGGNHEIGRINLNNFAEVFMAFESPDFAHDLKRFLKEQIEKAKKI